MNGLELLRVLAARGDSSPAIMITGHSDIGIAVEAMRAGASDFIIKPVRGDVLIASISAVLGQRETNEPVVARRVAQARLATLTPRQREILDHVLAGQPSKNIAADLGLSQRTVETHRAAIMKKIGAKSMPALVRLVVSALSAASTSEG
jgi:two-component system CheB/CheR fusion protein